MAKCGKGCMPECKYFTTGGCISPFNCMYKEESGYIISATSGSIIYTGRMNMTNEEMIENYKENKMANKTDYIPEYIKQGILEYLSNNCISLLSVSYDMRISYPTLYNILYKNCKARIMTIERIKKYFESKGVNFNIYLPFVDEEIE